MAVRAAVAGDSDAVAGVLVRAYESAWGPQGWDDYRRELGDVQGRSSLCEILVVESDGVVVGTVALVPPGSPMRAVDAPASVEIRMLAVDPAMQRRGLATTLIAAAADRARAAGMRSLVLQSDEDLVAAHAFYERLGFQRRQDLDAAVDQQYMALGFELAVADGGA